MGDKTGIEWTDATWNPIAGCSIVSPGCTNCYAMKMAHRIEAMAAGSGKQTHYAGTTQPSKAGAVWTGKVNLAPDNIVKQPLRWTRPRRIFVNSMSDLFHEDVPDEWIDRIFGVMSLTPQHTYQILTKRPERMRDYLSQERPSILDEALLRDDFLHGWHSRLAFVQKEGLHGWPLPNVWLGVSVEDQRHAMRIPHLLDTPASVRFISAEPLLGPLEIQNYLNKLGRCNALDWVIVGGESGPGSRPMHPDWARGLRDQCQAAGVPFFFKQWGDWAPGECAKSSPSGTEKTASYYADSWAFSKITRKQSEELHRDDEPTLYLLGKRNIHHSIDGEMHNAMPERKSA